MTKKAKPSIKAVKPMGEIISEYRKDHGMTQTDFADMMGISQQMVSFYEKGMEPPLDFIKNFKNKTGIDLIFNKKNSAEGVEIENLRAENNLLLKLVEEQKKRLALYEKLASKKLI